MMFREAALMRKKREGQIIVSYVSDLAAAGKVPEQALTLKRASLDDPSTVFGGSNHCRGQSPAWNRVVTT
jgi:hypothetical protein